MANDHNDNKHQPSDKSDEYKTGADLDSHLEEFKSRFQVLSQQRKPLYNPYKGKNPTAQSTGKSNYSDGDRNKAEKDGQAPSDKLPSQFLKSQSSSQPDNYSDEYLKRHLVRQRWLAEQSKRDSDEPSGDLGNGDFEEGSDDLQSKKTESYTEPAGPEDGRIEKSSVTESEDTKLVKREVLFEQTTNQDDQESDQIEESQTPPSKDTKVDEDPTDNEELGLDGSSQEEPDHIDSTPVIAKENEENISAVQPVDDEKNNKDSSPEAIVPFAGIKNRYNRWKKNRKQSDKKTEEIAEDSTEEPAETYVVKQLDSGEKIRFGFDVFTGVVGRLLRYLFIALLLIGTLVVGVGAGYFTYLVSDTEPPSEETMAQQLHQYDQQSTLYYASGEPIADVRTDLVRSVASLDEVSDQIIQGFIATEDEYFYEHNGIVPKAVIRAALETVLTGEGTGGSTITQQLVKQQMLTNDVTFFRKANEIMLALRVEQYFDKDEILTAYLNVSPFGRNHRGENIAGIGEAAQGIFGKSPNEVNLNQAAFLAGLPQDPYTYTPYDQDGQLRENLQPGIDRMQEVLFRMYRAQYITRDEYEAALNYDITQDFLPAQPSQEQRQTYLYQAIMHGAIEKLMRINIDNDQVDWKLVWADDEWYNEYYFEAEEQLRTGGYHVYSTIDKGIYDQLQTSARAYNDEIGVTYDGIYTDPNTGEQTYYIESVQTGLVVIENQTGRVLGFVAGTDYENNQIDHAFQMRRSPGSTIKPMAVYGPAIEHNIITPATMIPDTAYVQEFSDGSTWTPTNYGQAVSGELISTRRALLRSDNLPAVRIYEEVLRQGIPVIDYLEKMDFNTVDSYTEEDTHNLAFSLGGVTTGPTVFEETRGFTTFANNGEYIDGYYIERIEDSFGNPVFVQNKEPVRVFSEDTNYLMVDMLRDTMTEGTGRTANEYLNVPGDWIAKTGISENSKDIWVLASTPSITIGSWIGYDSRYADYTIDVNDGFGLESVRSQIYWARIVNDLYDIRPDIFGTDLTFSQPDSVVRQQVLEQTGTLPGTIQVNNQTVSLTGPLREEVFKASNPAPQLTYDFIFASTPEDLQRFWGQIIESQTRNNNQRRNESNESDESNNESNENQESESNQDENQPSGPSDTAGESSVPEVQPDDPQ